MKSARILLVLLMAASMSGCLATVRSTHPIGVPLEDTTVKDLAFLDGVWQAGQGVVYLKAIGPSTLRLAWTEWQGGEFVLHQTDVLLTMDDEVPYVNMLDVRPRANEEAYFFARAAIGDGGAVWSILAPALTGDSAQGPAILVFYPPNVPTFEAAVNDGVLPGSVEKEGSSTHVLIAAEKEALDDFINPEKADEQFDFNSPIILQRVVSFAPQEKQAGATNSGAAPATAELLPEQRELEELTQRLAKMGLELARIRTSSDSDETMAWSRRLCLSEMRTARQRPLAVQAALRHQAYVEAWLQECEEKRDRGAAYSIDVEMLRYYLLEAKLWLARAERGLPPIGFAAPPSLDASRR